MNFIMDTNINDIRPDFNRWFADNAESLRYEYPELNAEGAIVLDIGAYKGDFAKGILQKYPKTTVFSFEPVKKFYEQYLQSDTDRWKTFDCGLGGYERYETIALENDGSGIFNPHTNQSESCVFLDVAEQLKRIINRVGKVDLLKLNIEGMEYEVLDRIFSSGFDVTLIKNFQIQFHTFVDQCEIKRKCLRKILQNTHTLTYDYYFVWENWKLK